MIADSNGPHGSQNFLDITSNINNSESNYINCSLLKDLKHFSLGHLNIRSLDKNSENLMYLLQDCNNNMDILCISEIWKNTNNFLIPEFQPPATLIRNKKNGGGVAIYCKNHVKYKIIQEMTKINEYIEILTIEFKTNKTKGIVSVVYRPPSQNTTHIQKYLDDMNVILNYKNTHFTDSDYDILGDFNMDLLKYETSSNIRKFYQTYENNNISPLINRPTRVVGNNISIIDNILSNNSHNSKQYIICTSISDHFLIIKSTNIIKSNTKEESSYFRKLTTENTQKFKNSINNEDWSHIINTENTINKWELFFNKIDSKFNDSYPKIKKKIQKNNTNSTPWISNELKSMIKTERKLYLKQLKTKQTTHQQIHKEYKINLQTQIRKAKLKYYETEFSKTSNDPKNMWRTINKVTNRQTGEKNEKPKKIIINNSELTEDKIIAEGLNLHFNRIGIDLAKNIKNDPTKQQEYTNKIHEHNTTFKFKNISTQDIANLNKSIKPKYSAGPDEIPSIIIKIIMSLIPEVIANLINSSLNSGIIHNRLKAAIIIAIYKKGDKADPNNYRPIALINALSKILEKVVGYQLRKYLESNKILNNNQFGFRSLHSCTHAMINTLDHIEKNKNKNQITSAIFIDLTKAFDTVDTNTLLIKLKKIGIRNNELAWFKNYLTDRSHTCKIGDTFSSFLLSKIGVPQGSILGPLLFIIYINDLPATIKCFSNLFADDTMLAITDKNKTNLEESAKVVLTDTLDWFNYNKLTLNPTKTRAINFNTKLDITTKINNTSIQIINSKNTDKQETYFKFLGFHLDEKLNFESHVQKVICKLNSTNHILRNIKKIVPLKQRILIYNSLFRSQLEFGISIWANNKKTINKITTLQKRALLNLHGPSSKIHSEPLFKKYKILKFKDLIKYNNLMIGHSIFYEYAPKALLDIIEKESTHERLRRNLWNLKINGANKLSITNYIIPKDWNELSLEMKKIKNKNKFRKLMVNDIINDYNETINCNDQNCLICH